MVTDDSFYEEFPEDFLVGDPPVGRPYVGATKLELDMCFISARCQTDVRCCNNRYVRHL